MWLLGIYISVEVFIVFYKMDGGDKVCRMAKYTGALLVAYTGIAIGYSTKNPYEWVWLIPDLTVALFVWPATYARWKGRYQRRREDLRHG
jgi:hypothetical protein